MLENFLTSLDRFHDILERSRQVHLGKVRVRVLPGTFMRFRLGDTLRFINAHTQRHLAQIHRMLEHEQFPKVLSPSS